MSADLNLHCGGSEVSREALDLVQPPAATATWHPVAHSTFLQLCLDTLGAQGFTVRDQRLALHRDNHRFFAALDLTAQLSDGVALAVGLRNSTDKSFPLGFCAGSRVFVCSNLAFSSEQLVVKRHTKFGQTRFARAIEAAVKQLPQFVIEETARIDKLKVRELSAHESDSYILKTAEAGIVPFVKLPDLAKAYRQPDHEAFQPRTAWSMFNAVTHCLAPMSKTNPTEFTRRTIRLMSMFFPAEPQVANAA